MGIEAILKNALILLGTCHVLGMDADNFSAARKNIQACIDAIEKAKKEDDHHDHHDKQWKDGGN